MQLIIYNTLTAPYWNSFVKEMALIVYRNWFKIQIFSDNCSKLHSLYFIHYFSSIIKLNYIKVTMFSPPHMRQASTDAQIPADPSIGRIISHSVMVGKLSILKLYTTLICLISS